MAKNKKVKSKSTTKDSVVFAPDYITVNGHVYERQSINSVDVEIDLENDVLDKIDGLVSSGKYVSRGDAVRDILRNMIREEQLNK
jgi:hypothetical protein